MRRKRLSLARKDDEPSINLTPLIDVVFVILILFILIAPILNVDRIELASSHSNKEAISVQEEGAITLFVDEKNRISFNKVEIHISELPIVLEAAKKRYPSAKPQVFHDRKACFGTYQEIKNICETVGFAEMDVILNPGN